MQNQAKLILKAATSVEEAQDLIEQMEATEGQYLINIRTEFDKDTKQWYCLLSIGQEQVAVKPVEQAEPKVKLVK